MRILGTFLLVGALASAPAIARAQQAPRTDNPHGNVKAGLDCIDCHTSNGWKPMRADARFEHGRDTGYPLNGAHVGVGCTRCHLDLRFDEPKAKPAACSSCHVDVHRGSMPGTCVQCHTERDFHDVPVLAIHQRTGFPLAGAHLNTPCESCHRTEAGGAFSAVPRDCVSCHRADLERASASGIDHGGFSRECTTCHTALAWAGGANFDHVTVSGGFGLEGAHARQRCESCHVVPGFALRFTPAPAGAQDCIACHRDDYQVQHAADRFPTTCTQCHSTASWASTFNHDAEFPINSGAHRGKWASCATCHTSPGDLQAFSCFSCHEHNQASMDAKHQGRSGYVYASPSCYSCHPRGRA